FGARYEQDAVADAAPRFGLRSAVIGEHHHLHVGDLRAAEYFVTSSFGVVGVLCVDVEDGAEILVDVVRRSGSSRLHPFETLALDGFQTVGVQTVEGRSSGRSLSDEECERAEEEEGSAHNSSVKRGGGQLLLFDYCGQFFSFSGAASRRGRCGGLGG